MIDVSGVTFSYGRRREIAAIRELSFCCESFGITALVGGSGVGKSTLLALLAGIHVMGDVTVGEYRGTISFDGRSPRDFRKPSMVSWVPQQALLLDHLDVRENVRLPTRIDAALNYGAAERCEELLRTLGLESVADRRPRELSGGMRTRASLARALITNPTYLFLDEPFSSLDLGNRWKLYEFLRKERGHRESRTVFTTHNIPEAMLVSDRVLMMALEKDRTTIAVRENTPPSAGATAAKALTQARLSAATVEEILFLPA